MTAGSGRCGCGAAAGSRMSSLDPEIPFDWRFERSQGASTIADLGAHLIDLAGWMVGEIDCGQRAVADVHPRPPRSAPAAHARGRRRRRLLGAAALRLRCARGVRDGQDVRAPAVRLHARGATASAARCASTTPGSTSSGTGTPRIRRSSTGCAASAPSTARTPRRAGGGRSDRGSATARASSTRPPTCSSSGRTGPGRPTSPTGLEVQAVCEAIERAAAERRWVALDEVRSGLAPA